MINTVTARWIYDGDGANDTFDYDKRIDAESWLRVYVDDVLLALNTDYTVTGVLEDAGGTVVMTTPPPVGTANVVLAHVPPETQLVTFPTEGPLNSYVLERNIADKLAMEIQDLRAMFGTPDAGRFVRWDDRGQDLVADDPDQGLIETFYAVSVTMGAMFKDLVFTNVQADTTYAPGVIATNWSTTWSIPDGNKTTSQFRVAFDTPATTSAKIWVRVYGAI